MHIDDVRLNFQQDQMWVLNAIIALIMFGIALDLKADDFKRVLRSPRGPLIGLAAQFFLLPAATFLLTLALKPTPSIALGMILIAACPGGNLSNFLTHFANGNTALSLSMTAISSIAAILMTPLNVTLWGNLNPHTATIMREISLDPVQVFITVAGIIALPLVIGILCARHLPRFADKLHKPFKYGSVIFFILFVLIIFSKNYDNFINYIGAIFLFVVLHNVVALLSGNLLARFAKLPPRDRRAITIEVGIQNSALGLALIFKFFDGLGGMALIAGLWGMWHIVSGLTLAYIWSRRTPAPQVSEAIP
jgi:BASS family bile acid:Na+ symporter